MTSQVPLSRVGPVHYRTVCNSIHINYLPVCKIKTSIFEFLQYSEYPGTCISTIKNNLAHHMPWKANVSSFCFPHVSPMVDYHQGEHIKGKVGSASVYISNNYFNSADIRMPTYNCSSVHRQNLHKAWQYSPLYIACSVLQVSQSNGV